MVEAGLRCDVLSVGSLGFLKGEDTAPSFLSTAILEQIKLVCVPPNSTLFTRSHCVFAESLRVLCQVSVWEKRPWNPTIITTRPQKHSLLLYQRYLLPENLINKLRVGSKKKPHTRPAVELTSQKPQWITYIITRFVLKKAILPASSSS